MLKRKDIKILFLIRRNKVLSAVSGLVAEQTAIWQKEDTKKIDPKAFDRLKPIDITEMRKRINYLKELNEAHSKFLEENRKGDYMPLVYEELFSESAGKNISTITNICKFLEIAPPQTPVIDEYMIPSKSKINIEGIYKKLPNYKEIEEEFGKIF